MATRPQYTLQHAMIRYVTEADGGLREEIIKPAGHTFDLVRSQGKDALAVQKIAGEIEQGFYMIAKTCRISQEEVGYMDLYDIGKIGELIKSFTEAG